MRRCFVHTSSISAYPLNSMLLLLIFWGLIASSCGKSSDTILVQGTVISMNEDRVLPDVKVELYTRKIESGIYSANYVFFDSVFSDASGAFRFTLPQKSWASIQLYFSHPDYYVWDFELEGDVLLSDEGLNETFSLDPISWIHFNIANSQPVNDQDRLELRMLNGTRNCDHCCTDDLLIFEGMAFDEEWTCQLIGEQDIVIQWAIVQNGKRTGGNKNYFVPARDTIEVNFY